MPVYPPGFSERVFEFSFNAEYSNANRALLSAAPHIPTQNEEKWLGYDVAFELNRRGIVHSLALQHKVCRFVDGVARSNGDFWNAVGGPYYAFRVDVDQYNLIADAAAASLPGIEFFYCAPLFSKLDDLNLHYTKQTVRSNAIWLDISGAGHITDVASHSIVYAEDGSCAFLFSKDPRELKVLRPEQRKRDENREHVLEKESLKKTYDVAFEIVNEYWPQRRQKGNTRYSEAFRLPIQRPTKRETQTYEQVVTATRELLTEYFGLSWLVEVQT